MRRKTANEKPARKAPSKRRAARPKSPPKNAAIQRASGLTLKATATSSMSRLVAASALQTAQFVPTPGAIPWRWIAKLHIAFAGYTMQGTAWLSGRGALATAGHNIHHPQYGHCVAIDVVFDAGNGNIIHRVVRPQQGEGQALTSPAWRQYFRPEDDYGILVLTEPPALNYGCFDFATFPSGPGASQFFICGYPAASATQLGFVGGIPQFDNNFFYYSYATLPGMSGSPIFGHFGNSFVAAGIHTYGPDQTVPTYRGHRINPGIYNALMQYR